MNVRIETTVINKRSTHMLASAEFDCSESVVERRCCGKTSQIHS